ncbi:unnamed protein product [marine sediment metagenome]|uniref:Uncharacterized protein n=1 Tax=marine sediment metagenome TaxID=412755 RepID=X0TW11_9ZZZZ
MKLNTVSSMVARLFFAGAGALLILAIGERIANSLGYTVVREAFTASRLIELAVILVIFVIALLLRQIREELKQGTH